MNKCKSFQRNGKICNKNAKYIMNLQYYCGIHFKKYSNSSNINIDDYLIDKKETKKKPEPKKKKSIPKKKKEETKNDNTKTYNIKLDKDIEIFLKTKKEEFLKNRVNIKRLNFDVICQIHPDKCKYKDFDSNKMSNLVITHFNLLRN